MVDTTDTREGGPDSKLRQTSDCIQGVDLCALNCKYVTCFACYLLLLLPGLSAVLDLVEETNTQSYE